MRVKRSTSLMIMLEDDQFVFHTFLSQKTFLANPTALEIVRRLHAWTDLEAVFGFLPGYSRDSVVKAIGDLTDLGAILVEGSDAAAEDDDFTQNWLWGPLAAAYHFGTRVGEFMSDEAGGEMLRELVKICPSPPLYLTNNNPESDVVLPVRESYGEPFLTMSQRRTNRVMRDESISVDQIADCLLFSMAITAVIEDAEIVDLPLKMTPSGGARNPYEAYVCARRVEGLSPGVYHYSAMERTLGVVSQGQTPAFGDLLAGQHWASDAAAVIFLVANFERPMWKYHDGTAYRVTAIEAGHIAQNIMLVATSHGLVANPTGAMDFTRVEKTLGVGGFTKAVLYSLVIGVPGDPAHEIPA
jgi:SagB-type dehydrogenase family enzyme